MNLDQSAAALNVPRKTLEDYYLLLRKGLHYNFDFRQNREGKIGVLRAYLRKHEEVEENENDGRGRLN